ncbi:MAG: hypothetical protein A3F09_02695 [Chlamydiae bacterium RIFCSPHIGHO2_12_FULL_49_11]|nr:MAG: hypothetical protein A3F09_02695 [Chlamydiae bacterium RIFCSPHIGHO2_12_FULL_49_11]
MNKQIKNLLIGLFVIAGCTLVIAIILFIKPSVGDSKQVIHVRFNNINGIQIGTRVTMAGKPIGEVTEISRVPLAREKAVDHLGRVYFYLLTLHIDSHYKIFATDEITVQTAGLLGEKSIAIIPKPLMPGQHPHVITSNDIVYAESTDILETAVNELAALSNKFEETLQKVIDWMNHYGDDVGQAVITFTDTTKEIGTLVKSVNQSHIIQDVEHITTNVSITTDMINMVLTYLKEHCFFDNLAMTMQNITQITYPLAAGTSTLGKIIQDDGLYLEINAVMLKINTLLNDINNYGLLFQYNKKWQRVREKQSIDMQKLSTPGGFKRAVQAQIDQLNVTLGRMKMLSEASTTGELSCNKDFQKEFYEFGQKLKALQHEVDLYNLELFNQKASHGCEKACPR